MNTQKRRKVSFSFIFPIERCLYTPRLFLRRFSRAHAGAFLDLAERNQLWIQPWLPEISHPISLAEIHRIIECEHQESKRSQRLDLGIFHRTDGALVGRVSLHSVQWGVSFSAGLGYWIDLNLAGQGLMPEAVATLAAASFEEMNFHRLWAGIQPANRASQKVLEKLGFLREGLHRKELFINGKWQDQFFYSILDEEFRGLEKNWSRNKWLER